MLVLCLVGKKDIAKQIVINVFCVLGKWSVPTHVYSKWTYITLGEKEYLLVWLLLTYNSI